MTCSGFVIFVVLSLEIEDMCSDDRDVNSVKISPRKKDGLGYAIHSESIPCVIKNDQYGVASSLRFICLPWRD